MNALYANITVVPVTGQHKTTHIAARMKHDRHHGINSISIDSMKDIPSMAYLLQHRIRVVYVEEEIPQPPAQKEQA